MYPILLVSMLFALPFAIPLLGRNLNMSMLTFVLPFVLLAKWRTLLKSRAVSEKELGLVLVLLAYLSATCLWSSDKQKGLFFLISVAIGIGVRWLILSWPSRDTGYNWFEHILTILLVISATQLLVYIVRFHIDLSEIASERIMVNTVLGKSNGLASWCAIWLPLMVVRLEPEKSIRKRRTLSYLLSIAGITADVACLALTVSRGGIASAAIGLIVAWVTMRRRTWRSRVGFIALLATVTIAFSLPNSFLIPILGRLLPTNHAVLSSIVLYSSGRWDMWRVCLDMWFKSPILGTGLGSFGYYYPLMSMYQSVAYAPYAHNVLFQYLGETGIVGVMLICLYAREVLHREAYAMRQLEGRMISTAGLKGTIAALLVNLMIEPSFAGGPEAMTIVFMFLTLGEATLKQAGRIQASSASDYRGETHGKPILASTARVGVEGQAGSPVKDVKP